MKVRRRIPGAGHPGALAIALSTVAALAAAVSLIAGRFELSPGQNLQDRSSELFGAHPVVAGEALVVLRPRPDFARLRADLDAESDAIVGDGRVWRVRSRSKNVGALLNALAARRDVLYAEPNYVLQTTRQPNDPRFGELWGLLNIGQTVGGTAGTPGADVSAAAAWDVSIGGRTNVVGVVDTGIDYTHPDLAANVWSAPAPFTVTVGGQSITCAAGTHGFNAIARTCDPLDDHFHGTHVSGTIGGVADNGIGVAGVNWLANMMGLKFLNSAGSGSLADALNAIEFAIQVKTTLGAAANVRVLSNSWSGGGFSQALFDEINRANQNDMLFVAAAGNSSANNDVSPSYPASYALPNVVAVAATDNQDALASFSNFGAASVHLGAPGVRVLSTVPNGGYESFSGTSMATPHVSGAASLLLSRCTLTTAALKAAILDHVDLIAALAGRTITGGRLNVERALTACTPNGNRAPIVSLSDPPGDTNVAAPGPMHLSAAAGDTDGGGVASVAFYAGTALIGSVTSPPYERTWSNILVGNYAITAVAVDGRGAVATSASITAHVLPGPASLPYQGTEATLPGIIEAENFNEGGEGVGYHDLTPGNSGGVYRSTDVDIVATADGGDGFAVTSTAAGEWLAYRVVVQDSGAYTVQARVASAGVGGTFHVEVDGIDVTGSLAVPDTGGAQAWQTIGTQGVALTAGAHILRLVFDTKGVNGPVGNVNYLRVSVAGANTPPSITITAPANGASFAWPATVSIKATAGDADGTVVSVRFFAGNVLLGTDTTAPYAATWSNPLPGTYSLTAIATDNSGGSTTSAVTVQIVAPPPSTPFGGTPAVIPGIVQIENFDDGGEGVAYHDATPGNTGGNYRATDVDIEQTSDVGGGYSIGWITAGEWLMYTVSVASPASYALDVRVASPSVGGTFHVEVDRVAASGSITVPSTGGWSTWGFVSVPPIALSAGTHLLRIVFDTNGSSGFVGNVNYLRWKIPGTNSPPVVSLTSPAGGAIFSAPATISLAAAAIDDDGTITQVSFYNGATVIASDTTAPYTATLSGLAAGTYSLTAVATDNSGASTPSTPVAVQVVNPPPSSPFGGTRASVPGVVEMEKFDDGGEGVAYHDTTAGNTGNAFRSTDVDVETTADVGGGYSVGWAVAGEWLKYSITAASTGTYSLESRVAVSGAGGTYHVEVDGAAATGPIAVPSTGGWQTWASLTTPGISLSAGDHVVRVVFDTNGIWGVVANFNFMRWTLSASGPPPPSTPYLGVPAAIPGLVELEKFDDGGEGVAYHDSTPGNSGGAFRSTDVDIESTSDAGGGYSVGWITAGEWLKYSVSVAATALYTVDVRVAWPSAGGTFHVEVDGAAATGAIAIPATGGYQTWASVLVPNVALTQGAHVVRLVFDTNGASGFVGNINSVRWTLAGSVPPASTPFLGVAAAIPGLVELEKFDDGGEGVAYHDTTPGNSGGAFRSTDVDIESTSDTGGGYSIGWVVAGEWLNYSVTVAATAAYNVDIRVAWPANGGTFHIEVDGAAVTGAIAIPATGGYQAWASVVVPGVALTQGAHVVRLVFDTNGASGFVGNINSMRWTSPGS